jgi:hypothetical protein
MHDISKQFSLAPMSEFRQSMEESLGLEPGELLTTLYDSSSKHGAGPQADTDSGPTVITGVGERTPPQDTHPGSVGERESGVTEPCDTTVTSIIEDCPNREFALDLLGCLASHIRLKAAVLAIAVDRPIRRWMLVDAARREAVAEAIATTKKLRSESLHNVAENLVEAYGLAHEYDDSKYCTAAIEFANSVLEQSLSAGLGTTGRFTAAEAIDIFARHGFPIDPTLLTCNIDTLIDGYQALGAEYPELAENRSSSLGDSKWIAGRNLGGLLAAASGNPYVEYDDCGSPVSLLNDIMLAGQYLWEDPPVIEFRMTAFGNAVKTLTTTYPERCTADIVHDLEAKMVEGIVDSATNLESAILADGHVPELAPAMQRAEIRVRLWSRAVSSIVYEYASEPETQSHWARFAFDRAVVAVTGSAGSDRDAAELQPESLLQALYVQTVCELPAQRMDVIYWKQAIRALDTALHGTVDQHCPTVDAEGVRARALYEVAAEATDCRYELRQLIREGLVD